jgi:biopolymer transport protein ExbD
MLVKGQTNGQSPATIEITPVIDMVFLLLIFFLAATTFQQTEREMQIALPSAQSGGPISVSLRELVVNVDSEGAIYVGGQQMEVEDLRTIVTEAVAQNPDQKVTIRGDRAASYAAIAQALDVVKSSGIQEPFLDTVPLQ